VQALEGRLFDAEHGIGKPGHDPETVAQVAAQIERALTFRVGGDQNAVAAKGLLRELHRRAHPPSADAEGLRERIARIIAGPQADEAYNGRDVQMPDFDEHGSGMKVWQLYEPVAGKIVAALAAQSPPEPGWDEAIEAAASLCDPAPDRVNNGDRKFLATAIRSLKKPEATQP
jgi:hypothetical protein